MHIPKQARAAVTEFSVLTALSRKRAEISVMERDFYSLSYRYSGKITVKSNENTLCSESGSITFIPKGLPYRTEIIEDSQMIAVHFKLDRDIHFRNASVIQAQDSTIPLLFEKLAKSFRVDEPVNFHCMSLFYELLERLEKHAEGERNGRISQKLCSIREYVIQNYRDPDLNIDALAKEFGISTSYLHREFTKAYGTSPVTFLRLTRIGNAKNMLEACYLSIGEIAEQCGFSSASYFIQVFHKTVGESPNRYRQRMKE